ncbi:iron ABC transporter permease [Falsiroseomonas sp.]|uniref:FecCD family ABC transporter permease n=1 Tax=Falsiroseomonas sp. TaxID=2870721 RepID=UPI002715C0C4|nr:iron ABC transporter permease [Falsiroseomonas sp.]MDO9503642.1 iron ABC transporter permease [Falsiroseomonas sp.]
MTTLAPLLAADRRARRLCLGLAGLVILLFCLSLAVGPAPLALFGQIRGMTEEAVLARAILLEIRLPRALLGILVGGALGLSGAALQGFLRNPLAEPGLIGISATAALGAVTSFYFGLAGAFALALPLGGLAGAAIAVTLLYGLAGREASVLTLILAGVAVSSLSGALTALALNLAPSDYAALEIVFWLLGSLADRSLVHVWLSAPFILIGAALLLASSRGLEALTLGEETARSLGISLPRLRGLVIGGTALAVGAAVSVSGAIGFVGLIVPHLLRPLLGHRPAHLLPASALAGAALIQAADIAVRLVPTGPELKLGVVTALIGAPFFLHLLRQTRRSMR